MVSIKDTVFYMLVHDISINESVSLEEFTMMTVTGIAYYYTTLKSEVPLSYEYYGSSGPSYKKKQKEKTTESTTDPQIKKQTEKSS